MKHHAKHLAALALLVLLSGCALSDLWLDAARDECNQSTGAGPDRADCYQRAETIARDIDR